MDRRAFLHDFSRAVLACAALPAPWRYSGRRPVQEQPFSLGVASGDPLSDRCVIWTRLAPAPFEPEGGMDGSRTGVGWEVAHDQGFQRIVRDGRVTAAPELGYSVHVDVEGLDPDRWYFFRFHLPEATSPVGRLRTAPAAGGASPLRLAVASCQHYETGYFTAYEHMLEEEPDLVAHLGDYIYEYGGQDGRVRRHHGHEIRSVEDYRRRYAQYKSDPALQAMHAACPWVVTWDDHEVDNNYAGLVGENRFESREQMHARRAAAYQVWFEHQPVRIHRPLSWADLTITRSFHWGRLADLRVLDTRQYRTDQPCTDDPTGMTPCTSRSDPGATLLGARQEEWLLEGLRHPSDAWQVLVQQVMMAPFDSQPGAGVDSSTDQWSGYPVARDHLLNAIAEHASGRTVVLTGDIHSNWVNDLRAGFDRPDRPVVAAEFVGTSITSSGDGADAWESVEANAGENPHLRWHNARRGYVRCDIGPDAWTTTYRTLPWVSRPNAPIGTASTWRLEKGRAGIMEG